MKLSIIIPTLNEEKYLPKLLTDLSAQREKDFEVIVVDAFSDDNTIRVVQKYTKALHVTTIQVKKRNVSYQRNIGVKEASGKYVAFIDADSRVNPSYVKKIIRAIDKMGHLVLIPEIIPEEHSMSDKMLFNFVNILIELSQYTAKPFSSGGFMIVERNFFYHLGGFNEKCYLSEDHDLVQRAKKIGVQSKLVRGLKIRFSIRRFKKEGRLDLFIKYIIGAIYTLKKGGITKRLFEYEMGGTPYKGLKKTKPFSSENITEHINKLKNYLSLIKKLA